MTTTDFILKELCNVIDFDKHYTSLDDVQMTVSMPQIIELVNKAIKQERETEREACAKVCDVLAVHPEYASEVTKLAALAIRARGNT